MTGDWRDRARCLQTDPELWFPEKGTRTGEFAKRICAQCPVQRQCLDYALNSTERLDGIWGGMTETERRKLRLGQFARAS